MAYLGIRPHPDNLTSDFLTSIGGIELTSCSDDHSVWSVYQRHVYIPFNKVIHNMNDLLDFIYSQAYDSGVENGKQRALSTLNQEMSNIVFGNKK